MRTALAAFVLALGLTAGTASATIVYPDRDYVFVFTGHVTEVTPYVDPGNPDIYYRPFLQVGDPVQAAVGVNYIGDYPVYKYLRNGNTMGYPVDAFPMSDGYFKALVVPRPNFDPGRDDFWSFDYVMGPAESQGLAFDLFTRELVHAEFSTWTDYTDTYFYSDFSIAEYGGRISQNAERDQFESAPDHQFRFTGTWETVKFLDVPEPTSWSLLLGGVLAAGFLRSLRRRSV